MSCDTTTCCLHKGEVAALSVEQVDELKVSAQSFGFDGTVVADILEKFGPEVLSLLVEATRSGFSVAWALDTLKRFGPAVLQFFVDLWTQKMSVAALSEGTGVIIDSQLVEGMDSSMLSALLEKLLPVIVEKYGPQLLDLLMQTILNAIKK